METSQPSNPLIRYLFHFFTRLLVLSMTILIPRAKRGYKYLALSILNFYNAEELAGIYRKAGFAEVKFKKLTFGAAALHIGVKK